MGLFRWTLKPEFGEVPQYLIRNKQHIADEKASIEEHIRLRQQQVSGLHVCMKLAAATKPESVHNETTALHTL